MEKIVISVEDMAAILENAFEQNIDVVSEKYCRACSEMHDGCPLGEESDGECLHEKIVEYRFFVRSHFRKYMVKE